MSNSIYRFIIGNTPELRSAAWRIWTQKDECYMLMRSMGEINKISFHKSGICRWAHIKPMNNGQDRLIKKWTEIPEPVPNIEPGFLRLLMRLVVPSNHLSSTYRDDYLKCNIITPASAGKATQLNFLKVHKSIQIESLLSQHYTILGKLPLKTSDYIAIVMDEYECGPIDLVIERGRPHPGQVFGELHFPDIDTTGSGRPIRLLLVSGEGFDQIFGELGGYERNPV